MSSATLGAVALRLMTHRASSSAPSASTLLSPCLPLRLTATLFRATAFRMTAAAMLIAEVQEPDGDDGTCAPMSTSSQPCQRNACQSRGYFGERLYNAKSGRISELEAPRAVLNRPPDRFFGSKLRGGRLAL